jgi:ribosome-associated protein
MAGMSDKNSSPACTQVVLDLARFLIDSKAQDVQILDISKRSGYADYLIIATVNSVGQMRGLVKNTDDELMVHGIHARGARRVIRDDDEWVLLDCADFIIHFMTKTARDFYALERLWIEGGRLDPLTGERHA